MVEDRDPFGELLDLVEVVVTDGPLAEAEQVLGGYHLVDCAGLDRATEIAARLGEAEFAPVVVRRLSEDSSWSRPMQSHA